MLYQYEKIDTEEDLTAINMLLGAKFGQHCNGHRKGKAAEVCVTMKCPSAHAHPLQGSRELSSALKNLLMAMRFPTQPSSRPRLPNPAPSPPAPVALLSGVT